MEQNNGASRGTGTVFSIGGIGDDTDDVGSGSTPRTEDETARAYARGSGAPVSSVKAFGKRKRKGDEKLAKASAEMIVGTVETFSVMRYGANGSQPPDGNDGRLLPPERKMMTEGLSTSLASLPVEITEQVSALSAPVMAALGLLLYLSRVSILETRRKANIAESRRSAGASAVMQAERIANESGVTGAPDLSTLQDLMGGS